MSACGDIGIESSTYLTGGGSDGNIFPAHGVPTLVLACGLHGAHSTSERLVIEDLRAMTNLLTAVADRLCAGEAEPESNAVAGGLAIPVAEQEESS